MMANLFFHVESKLFCVKEWFYNNNGTPVEEVEIPSAEHTVELELQTEHGLVVARGSVEVNDIEEDSWEKFEDMEILVGGEGIGVDAWKRWSWSYPTTEQACLQQVCKIAGGPLSLRCVEEGAQFHIMERPSTPCLSRCSKSMADKLRTNGFLLDALKPWLQPQRRPVCVGFRGKQMPVTFTVSEDLHCIRAMSPSVGRYDARHEAQSAGRVSEPMPMPKMQSAVRQPMPMPLHDSTAGAQEMISDPAEIPHDEVASSVVQETLNDEAMQSNPEELQNTHPIVHLNDSDRIPIGGCAVMPAGDQGRFDPDLDMILSLVGHAAAHTVIQEVRHTDVARPISPTEAAECVRELWESCVAVLAPSTGPELIQVPQNDDADSFQGGFSVSIAHDDRPRSEPGDACAWLYIFIAAFVFLVVYASGWWPCWYCLVLRIVYWPHVENDCLGNVFFGLTEENLGLHSALLMSSEGDSIVSDSDFVVSDIDLQSITNFAEDWVVVSFRSRSRQRDQLLLSHGFLWLLGGALGLDVSGKLSMEHTFQGHQVVIPLSFRSQLDDILFEAVAGGTLKRRNSRQRQDEILHLTCPSTLVCSSQLCDVGGVDAMTHSTFHHIGRARCASEYAPTPSEVFYMR